LKIPRRNSQTEYLKKEQQPVAFLYIRVKGAMTPRFLVALSMPFVVVVVVVELVVVVVVAVVVTDILTAA